MAVIMALTLADRLVLSAQGTSVVERDHRHPGLLHRIVHAQVLGGATDRAGPLALDVHEAHTVRLQPAKDPLGLLGGGGRSRTWAGDDRLGRSSQPSHPVACVGTRRNHPGRRQPAVADNVHRPPSVLAAGAPHPPSRGGARTPWGPGVGGARRGGGPAPRRKALGGPRHEPASSNRLAFDNIAMRCETDFTTASGRASKDSRRRATTAA